MSKKNIYDTALYLRLSKDDADIDGSKKTESNSISSQRDLLRAYVQSHEDLRLFDIYIDERGKFSAAQCGGICGGRGLSGRGGGKGAYGGRQGLQGRSQ